MSLAQTNIFSLKCKHFVAYKHLHDTHSSHFPKKTHTKKQKNRNHTPKNKAKNKAKKQKQKPQKGISQTL